MADIFISYSSHDRAWAHWIAHELQTSGHRPHVHEWEIAAGDNIAAWIEKRVSESDAVLCVLSKSFMNAPSSSFERRAAQWAAAQSKGVLPVFVEPCDPPTFLAALRGCELYGISEEEARVRLRAFLASPKAPSEKPRFPGQSEVTPRAETTSERGTFPGGLRALSNVPFSPPRHFLGRDEVLAAIEKELYRDAGSASIVALHGLPGVGKSTVAAAYAEQHRYDYRVTWWIRAHSVSALRADVAALGTRLGWISSEDREEQAVAKVIQRLRDDGRGILLIFDNTADAGALRPYLPRVGGSHVIVTSTANAGRRLAASLDIRAWPKEIGADYLIARSGSVRERASAEELSEALGGLPLALEQAAAYCERLQVSFATYTKRLEATPIELDYPAASTKDFGELTIAKTVTLAIDEAAKLHPGADPLIMHCAFLAPAPIPLSLFENAQEKFDARLAAALAGDGLHEAVAVLRAFALVDYDIFSDEVEPSIAIECIKLHRLVRQVAQARFPSPAQNDVRLVLLKAIAIDYPQPIEDPETWPYARRLDALAFEMANFDIAALRGGEEQIIHLLSQLAAYRHHVLAADEEARKLSERALIISEETLGPEHPTTVASLVNVANLSRAQGDLSAAHQLLGRALAILGRTREPNDPRVAVALGDLAAVCRDEGDLHQAQSLAERALAINEEILGPEHANTARSLGSLAEVLVMSGNLAAAGPLLERALAIRQRAFGPEHPDTAIIYDNLAALRHHQGDWDGALRLFEHSLAINERAFGAEHPRTAASLNRLAGLLRAQGHLSAARAFGERALLIFESRLGAEHPRTAAAITDLARTLKDEGNLAEARVLYERALAISEKVLGRDNPATASIDRDLALLLASESMSASAPSERHMAIERLTRSGRDPVTRDILSKMLGSDPDSGVRGLIVAKLAELWPDEQTQNILISCVKSDDSADIRAACLELLSRTSWRQCAVRQLLRSRVELEAGDHIRERALRAAMSAGLQVSSFWERTLSGQRDADEEPELLPGYPAFRIAQFRLRNIGPVRDSGVVDLSGGVNIFLGDNAAGKTTILRALGLATIGPAAANEVEDRPIAYLRKGADVGTIEALFELIPDPSALSGESGYFAVGLQIAAGSSRFGCTPDSEMSLCRPGQPAKPMRNSAEYLGSLRSIWPSQFGFVCGYGAVRTFSDSRFSIQPEAQKSENEWVLSLFRPDAWLVNPEVFAKLIRGDTSNIEGAPAGALPVSLTDTLRGSLKCLLPEVNEFFNEGENDLQVRGMPLRFAELSEGYRSLLALLGHMLRCALKARDWKDDPSQIDGITLIDELDLHLHPTWQGHVVQDFRNTFRSLQLIASTHSPLVVGPLKREDVLILERDEGGYTTIRRPDLDPQGLGVGGVLTGIFDLGSTIDQPTLDKISQRLLLHAKRETWSDAERQEYQELTDYLSGLGFTRELVDPYFDRFASAMARRHKATVEKLSTQQKRELDEYADQLLSELAEQEGK